MRFAGDKRMRPYYKHTASSNRKSAASFSEMLTDLFFNFFSPALRPSLRRRTSSKSANSEKFLWDLY